MEGSSLFDALSVYTSCVSHAYGLSCEKSRVEIEDCACWNNEETAENMLQVIPNVPTVSEKDAVTVQKAASASCLILPIGDLQGQFSGPNATSDGKILEPKEVETYQELRHSAPLDVKKQKSLSKSATFPCSVEANTTHLSIGGGSGLQGTDNEDHCSSTSNKNSYARSISLPASDKLISAMKGSRAQNGSPSDLKLHVKWAPEVYDPPSTSMSHTVKKSHQQRPKLKKNYSNKHKRKSKSMRAARRIANGNFNNMPKPVDMRLQSGGDSLLLSGPGKSSVEVLEYAVCKQDSKCGSSFLREALGKLNLSVAEAI